MIQLPNHSRRIQKFGILGYAIFGFIIAVVAGFLAYPVSVSAQKTTSANIRAAVTYASQTLGICTPQNPNDADCKRQVYRCSDADWAEYIEDAVEFGGPTVIKKNDARLPNEVIDYLNKNEQNRSRIPPFWQADCFCVCEEDDINPPCIGAAGTERVLGMGLLTREECAAICAPRVMAPKCAGALSPVEYGDGTATAAATEETTKAAALQLRCFTREECLKQEGLWEAFAECRNGKGHCYAEAPAIALNVPIGGVKEIKGFDEYIIVAYRYLLSVLVVVTTIMFIYGAFRYLVGASLGSVSRGKEIMIDAVIGMLLVLGATTILRTVNPALTNLNPLKVYMINTVRNISAMYCSDLSPEMKLADAGETQKIRSREEVEKAESAYVISSKKAVCGRSYYVEGSAGGPCEGSFCEKKGEACVSCVDAEFSECNRVAGAYKVCAKLEFGGNINYADGRYPEKISLVFACAAAKNPSDFQILKDNLEIGEEQEARVVRGASVGTLNQSTAGTSAYHIDLDEGDIKEARTDCAAFGAGNKLLGAFLAVEYNGGVAVLSRAKCTGGGGKLSGYANGGDPAEAFLCAIRPPNSDFENPATAYWTADELLNAATGGGAITCNFNLDNASAPEDPGDQAGYCMSQNSSGAGKEFCTNGGTCTPGDSPCRTADGKTCACVTRLEGGMAISWYWLCK